MSARIAAGTIVSSVENAPTLHRLAPAKINLTLRVVRRRPDGYHDIVSWIAPLNLADELTLSPAAGGGPTLVCDHPTLPRDGRNLAVRAADALARHANRPANVAIRLTKRIPVGGGLGGGSSDAAAVLVGLAELWDLRLGPDAIADLAADLGSDVPLFVVGRQAIVRGRGERVEPVASPWNGWVVLVLPPWGVSTAVAYSAWRPADSAAALEEPGRLQGVSTHELRQRLYNDLEPAAFRVEPHLAELHARLNGLEGVPARMSGSGSSLFAIFDQRAEAEAWRRAAARACGPEVSARLCATRNPPEGISQGASQHGDH